jgi:anionic cell wall polymer biosynthesis LytR-Cps2A-Psr (LCP) family protein
MHYEDPYASLVINLTKGYQHLNGSQSGQYVRFRSDELGDIGRVQRQQRFLKALTEQDLQLSNIWRLPMLIREIDQYVATDITGVQMIKLANNLKKFKSANLVTEMLPGNFATIDGLSYWVHNKEQTRLMVERVLINDNTRMSGIFIP